VEAAQAQMPLVEHEYWEAFLRGSIRLPDIDWSVDREDEPTSKKSLKAARRRAEALNRLYGTDQARPSHSVVRQKSYRVSSSGESHGKSNRNGDTFGSQNRPTASSMGGLQNATVSTTIC